MNGLIKPELMSEESLIGSKNNEEGIVKSSNQGSNRSSNRSSCDNQAKNGSQKRASDSKAVAAMTQMQQKKIKVGIPKKTGSLGRVRRNYYHRSSCDYGIVRDYKSDTRTRTREWLLNNTASSDDRSKVPRDRRCHSLNLTGSLITNVSISTVLTDLPKVGTANGIVPRIEITNPKPDIDTRNESQGLIENGIAE